jgi:CheY-like chemotaxis protein
MQDNFAHVPVVDAANIEAALFFSAYLTSPNKERATASGFSGSVADTKPLALVVDDAPDVLEMLAILLRHEGYEVTTAASATAALQAAQSEHFDVVVSDIGMPGMDGYGLAAALRSMPDYRAVPLVAVTGFDLYDDRERAMKSGFNAHLTKPINPMSLLDLIAQLRGQG